MIIRVLHLEGCPNLAETLRVVRVTARSLEPSAAVEVIEIESEARAARLRFLGSPTVQVDGIDIDPAAHDSTAFGMACRRYGGSGVPAPEMIAAAILKARVSR